MEKWVRSPDYVRSQLSYTPTCLLFQKFSALFDLLPWEFDSHQSFKDRFWHLLFDP